MYRGVRSNTWFIILFFCAIVGEKIGCPRDDSYPIDIVYLWVDGSDSVWQEIKETYLALALHEGVGYKHDGYAAHRFANNDELRYSLRSIMAYAPFFNHIYIVTMNQRPEWLIDHPAVTIIDHKQIFRNQGHLPTFNSHALESNLHRIPGLKEHFIYFNDDVFLGGPVSPEDFFTPDGKIKVLFEASLSPSGPPVDGETAYRRAWRNTNAFLDKKYRKERRLRLCHAPFALKKSLIMQAEDEMTAIFEANSSHRFRGNDDFNITNGLLQYYWLYHGHIVAGALSNKMVSLYGDGLYEQNSNQLDGLYAHKIDTFCLQDVMGPDNSATKKALHNFLERYYPQKAPWEH